MRTYLFAAALFTPTVALAASPKTFQDLANIIVTNINALSVFLILAGLVIYFYGLSINILKMGEDREKFRNYFFWGIIVLFVMVSIWGILRLLQESLFGSSGTGTTPTVEETKIQDITFN